MGVFMNGDSLYGVLLRVPHEVGTVRIILDTWEQS